MPDATHAIPIDALFGQGLEPNSEVDPRPGLNEADVIFGVDVMTQHQFLVYGRDALQEVVQSGQAKMLNVLRIGLDQETGELAKLLTVVVMVKGEHHYKPGAPPHRGGGRRARRNNHHAHVSHR